MSKLGVCTIPLEVKQGPRDAGGCFEGRQQLFAQLHRLSTEYLTNKDRISLKTKTFSL